ncbi:hypothetical protein EHS25_007878 [Saitozyma podzolica]|uniref:Isochorismatase-like domain-containing protein n=1 Tax=Saitozyma podzolica TaxID=1890683 RepID=A0A427YR16_9TREE|nr:hypothetical protein EHS25_007878 [Saitozyma podzolica]
MSSFLRVPNPRNTVLLICDVQERLRAAVHGFDAMNGSIVKMIQAAKLLEMRVLATEQNPKAPEIGLADIPENLYLGLIPKKKVRPTVPLLSPPHLAFSWWALFSMMTPEVESIIAEHKFETAILVGIESHVCVLQTALSLLRSGLGVYVLADAVSSCNRQEVPVALSRMRQAGAVVSTSESIIFELLEPELQAHLELDQGEKSSTATALGTLLDSADKPNS